MIVRFRLIVALLLLGSAPTSHAQLPFALDVPLTEVPAYDARIPTPEEVIGHRVGTRHTEPHQVVEYFRAIAELSDRVSIETYAATYEGRPLVHAVVTSSERHADLDAVRDANRRLSDTPNDVSDAELEAMPVVVYAGYSVHGNEASGSEAALLLLYHLAAGQSSEVLRVLENAVVLIDPMLNPDGRNRFTSWVNRNRGAVPVADPADREHDEPWPGGRTNHYWFDLNRDWLPAQHPESQGRLRVYHAWRPQLLTDHHEMGSESTFFFQPGIPSRNNPNTPEGTFELTRRLARYHAGALDRIGSLYYTRESFDDFYYGKGSTYPDINGGVGILFEQASSRALLREVHGDTLSYAFTIRNQFMASLSTLEGAVEMRPDLLRHQRDFYAGATEFARRQSTRAYVLDAFEAPARTAALRDVLTRHRIRVHKLARDVTLDGRTFRADESVIVPVDQPQARLVKAALERVTTFGDSLFYDVSAWTLPLAFGVPFGELRSDPSAYVGDEVRSIPRHEGGVFGGRSDYAYVMEWGGYYAPRALYRFQQLGLRTRVMTEPFSVAVDGQSVRLPRGSIVIPVNGQDIHDEIASIAETDGVAMYAVRSGLTSDGPDIGSRGAEALSKPTIALLTGSGAAAYETGEVWHLLSERFGIPVSLLDSESVGTADLRRYTTIVMAGGGYGALAGGPLESWLAGGGHLIALTDAIEWVAEQNLVELEEREIALDSLYVGIPYEALERAQGAHQIGGMILQTELDPTHPIGYGYGRNVAVFRSGETFFEVPEKPGQTVARYADDPLLSGYISEERLDQARGSASVLAVEKGQGRVTLFLDNPNFRAFWYGTNGLFLNAIFFGSLY